MYFYDEIIVAALDPNIYHGLRLLPYFCKYFKNECLLKNLIDNNFKLLRI